MRNTIKKFNSHIYLYYEYKALLKIKAETFNRDYFIKSKKRTAKTITDENKKPVGILHIHDLLKAGVA